MGRLLPQMYVARCHVLSDGELPRTVVAPVKWCAGRAAWSRLCDAWSNVTAAWEKGGISSVHILIYGLN